VPLTLRNKSVEHKSSKNW